MTATTIRVQMAQRKDTAANWTAANPILLSGEIGYETDTKKFKIGDGTTNWNSLAYLPIPDGSGNLTITGNLEIGTTGSLTFEGSTANGFETTLAVTDPTADRTITLPNVSGTVVTTGDTGSVTSTMIADGTIVNADISGSAEIAVSKLANGTANQVIVTDGTNVSWSDNLTLAGDLTVNGTTTTINTQDLLVEDKNIIIGNVATPTDLTADGGGITLKGSTDKTINWVDSTDAWTLSENVNIASGKEYRIDGTKVLDATSLGSGVVSSSLTSVGTIGTGVWQGTAIDAAYLDSTIVTTGDTGTVTSTMIADGTIVDGDVNASAAIAGTKISPNFGSQNVTTTGTATAAALIPSGSSVPANGVYLPSANNVAISTNGTGRLFVDASGRVGVGAATPSSLLNLAHPTVSDVRLTVAGNLIGNIYGSSSDLNIHAVANVPLTFATNNTERMRLDSSGRLGLGTSSPSYRLHVQAPTNTTGLFLTTTSAGTAGDYSEIGFGDTAGGGTAFSAIRSTFNNPSVNGASALRFFTNGGATSTEKMTITSAGLVGIGTTSAISKLHVSNSGAEGFEFTPGSASNTNLLTHYNRNGSFVYVNSQVSAASHQFFIGASEAARIDSSSRLLVGTSTTVESAALGNARFQVSGTGNESAQASISRFSNDDASSRLVFIKSRGSAGSNTIVQNGDSLGTIVFQGADGSGSTAYLQGAIITANVDGTPGTGDLPTRLVFSTTADGASSPTERMRISSEGGITTTGRAANSTNANLAVRNGSGNNDAIFEASDGAVPGISGSLRVSKNNSNSRSINASGTVNQNGADYAEYFKKCGNFVIQKADVVGINSSGLLTNIFADAISFCVKSTDPGLVGGDNWFTEPRPRTEGGQEVDSSTPEYAEWMKRLELARATVDRIAFAGQVPVNVTGATPGQYIVPIATEDGGITGIAKDETDLTLAEYMQAVGKVIAIEDDGRARIIVKVA